MIHFSTRILRHSNFPPIPRENPQICDSSQRVIAPGFVFLSFSIGLWLAVGSSWDVPAIKISPVDGCNRLVRLLATNGDWVLTVARVVLGIAFFVHGSQKLLGWFGGHGLSATIKTFRDQMGIPAPLTYLAIAAEFFGGLGLIIGLLTRVAALGIAITMVVAMIKVHLKFGFLMNWFGDKQGHGIEYHLLAIALAIIIIVHGAGAFSLDRVLYRDLVSPEKVALDFSLVVPFFFRLKPAFIK